MTNAAIGSSLHRGIALLTACLLWTGGAFAQKSAPAAGAPTIVLRGGKLLTVSHGVIENGVLVMANGKIASLGPAASTPVPKGAEVIDVSGMTVYPGLIDSETHLGLTEISAESSTNDLAEPSEEVLPQLHVWEAFHAETAVIPVTRVNGITNAIVAPTAQDTIPGQDAFIQLTGASRDQMLLVKDVAMPLNFTGEQRRNQSWEKAKFPFTRMGMAAQLRQAFVDAEDYQQRLEEYAKKPPEQRKTPPPKRDLQLEALLPYLRGERPVVLAAEEPSDLDTALGLAREFHLKVILNHVSHSQRMLDQIAATRLPVIVGPIYEEPKDDERYDAVYKLPAELFQRGVKIAFASYTAHESRNLPYQAGYAVAFGLPYEEALKALTMNPAEIWGVADRLGSLDAGKTANVVVANGDPLDVKTDVKRVFIQGREVPMTNRQMRLRDQYMK